MQGKRGSRVKKEGRHVAITTTSGETVEVVPEEKWHWTIETLREMMDEKAIQEGLAWANRKTQFLHGIRKICKTETIEEAMYRDSRNRHQGGNIFTMVSNREAGLNRTNAGGQENRKWNGYDAHRGKPERNGGT